jgi:hypothetical protein
MDEFHRKLSKVTKKISEMKRKEELTLNKLSQSE